MAHLFDFDALEELETPRPVAVSRSGMPSSSFGPMRERIPSTDSSQGRVDSRAQSPAVDRPGTEEMGQAGVGDIADAWREARSAQGASPMPRAAGW